MSRISHKTEAEFRKISKNRCGYCRLPQKILMGKLEIEHIYVLIAGNATVTKVQIFMALMEKPTAKKRYLTRELKIGKDISRLAGTKPESSAKLLADAQPLQHCE